MKTIQIGTRLKLNSGMATVIKVEGNHALIKTEKGGQYCYGINGIHQNQIEDQLTLAL